MIDTHTHTHTLIRADESDKLELVDIAKWLRGLMVPLSLSL